MSRDRLTRATPDVAEPDTDRPKTDGWSQTQSYPDGQGDTPTHRQTGKQTNRDKGTVNQIQTETQTEAFSCESVLGLGGRA